MKDLSNQFVIHQKEGKVAYLQFRKLLEYPELIHAYTLSTNDFDVGGNETYKSKKEVIRMNYENLAGELGFSIENIVRPYQTHTNQVQVIKHKQNKMCIFPKELQNIDGLVTDQKDILFSLTFADCTPLYLWEPIQKVIANVHSGWKGTLNGIGKVAVQTMVQEYGADPKQMIACIGPHIRKCHFEVKEDLAKQFYEKCKGMKEIITYAGEKEGEPRYYIDTAKINENRMLEMGLKKENIIDCGICSVCNKDQIHSYRGGSKGRNTAIIGMK